MVLSPIKNIYQLVSPKVPVCFIIYINDLENSTSIYDFIMHADDTTLFCNVDSIPEANRHIVLNSELDNISCNWLASNKLSLNVSKTKYIFCPKQSSGSICYKIGNPKYVLNIPSFDFDKIYTHSIQSFALYIKHIQTHTNIYKTLCIISYSILFRLFILSPLISK